MRVSFYFLNFFLLIVSILGSNGDVASYIQDADASIAQLSQLRALSHEVKTSGLNAATVSEDNGKQSQTSSPLALPRKNASSCQSFLALAEKMTSGSQNPTARNLTVATATAPLRDLDTELRRCVSNQDCWQGDQHFQILFLEPAENLAKKMAATLSETSSPQIQDQLRGLSASLEDSARRIRGFIKTAGKDSVAVVKFTNEDASAFGVAHGVASSPRPADSGDLVTSANFTFAVAEKLASFLSLSIELHAMVCLQKAVPAFRSDRRAHFPQRSGVDLYALTYFRKELELLIASGYAIPENFKVLGSGKSGNALLLRKVADTVTHTADSESAKPSTQTSPEPSPERAVKIYSTSSTTCEKEIMHKLEGRIQAKGLTAPPSIIRTEWSYSNTTVATAAVALGREVEKLAAVRAGGNGQFNALGSKDVVVYKTVGESLWGCLDPRYMDPRYKLPCPLSNAPLSDVVGFTSDILQALQFLHDKMEVAHCDVTINNVIVYRHGLGSNANSAAPLSLPEGRALHGMLIDYSDFKWKDEYDPEQEGPECKQKDELEDVNCKSRLLTPGRSKLCKKEKKEDLRDFNGQILNLIVIPTVKALEERSVGESVAKKRATFVREKLEQLREEIGLPPTGNAQAKPAAYTASRALEFLTKKVTEELQK